MKLRELIRKWLLKHTPDPIAAVPTPIPEKERVIVFGYRNHKEDELLERHQYVIVPPGKKPHLCLEESIEKLNNDTDRKRPIIITFVTMLWE